MLYDLEVPNGVGEWGAGLAARPGAWERRLAHVACLNSVWPRRESVTGSSFGVLHCLASGVCHCAGRG